METTIQGGILLKELRNYDTPILIIAACKWVAAIALKNSKMNHLYQPKSQIFQKDNIPHSVL